MSSYANLKEEKSSERKCKKEKKETKQKLKESLRDKIIIGSYSEAPDYLKDNEYIKSGYLINCNSFKLVLRSLFVFSNETINIWSHLIGCIISVLLIIFIAFFIQTEKVKELSQIEYENMKLKVDDAVKPWINHLSEKRKENNEINNINISYMLEKMKTNSQNLLNDYGNKDTVISNLEKFVERNENLMHQIVEISNDSNILNMIIKKWEVCSNKITYFINKYIVNEVKGENIGRWPLFVMLCSAILCFGCSTLFHWFSIYSKELYSFLSRLDYAGITFLIPGSCYPPYYYFYYCEKCK
jgi:adiponectin receptor